MKKIIITLALILVAIPAYASWETTGNVVGANDFIGATNNSNIKFKIAGQEIYRIQPDGMRFMKPITTITNDNGQFILNHVTATGCTGIYGNINKILNICDDGFTFTGGPLNFKTKYTVYSGASSYTLQAKDYTVEFENGGKAILPTATSANTGTHYEIINPTLTELPVYTVSNQLIGNINPEQQYIIGAGEGFTFISNGSMWRVMK